MTAIITSSHIDLRKPSADTSVAVIIDSGLKHVMLNGVTIYGKPFAAEPLTQLLDEHQDLFVDQDQTVNIPKEKWMPIFLKPNAVIKSVKVYSMG